MAKEQQINERTYASILKTISMFLENNGFRQTAEEFRAEVQLKFQDVNVESASPRTLVLRPLDGDPNVNGANDVVICVTGQENINIDITELCPDENKHAEKLKLNLKKLQEEHVKLMSVASELTDALSSLEGSPRKLTKDASADTAVDAAVEVFVGITSGKGSPKKSPPNSPHSATKSPPAAKRTSLGFAPEEDPPFYKPTKRKSSSVKSRDVVSPSNVMLIKMRLEDEVENLNKSVTIIADRSLVDAGHVRPPYNSLALSEASNYLPSEWVPDENVIVHKHDLNASAHCPRCNAHLELNYKTIKQDLLLGEIDLKLRILQALRWRLTRADRRTRNHHVVEYVKWDLLYLDAHDPVAFVKTFLCPKNTTTPHPLQEEMARFVNTLTSLSLGRDYLYRSPQMLPTLFLPLLTSTLEGIEIFDLTRQFIVAAVQKLSLNANVRKTIIEEGTVEWLVLFIRNNLSAIQNYEAEYSVALLTNLCIHNEMRERCASIPDVSVHMILELLGTHHDCCLVYISGILYSLLSNQKIRELALRSDVTNKLRTLITSMQPGKTRDGLEVVAAMLSSGSFTTNTACTCTADENGEMYSDVLEPELDMYDPIYGDPTGETLLEQYNDIFQNPGKQMLVLKQKVCACTPCGKCSPDTNIILEPPDGFGPAIPLTPQKLSPRTTAYSASPKRLSTSFSCQSEGPLAPQTSTTNNSQKHLMDVDNVLTEVAKMVPPETDQVHPVPYPSIIVPCRLNYYYLNEDQAGKCSKDNGKYSCGCYESIKAVLDEVDLKEGGAVRDRQGNNVVYGPFKAQLRYSCSCHKPPAVDGKDSEEAFESRPKIIRTP